MAKQKAMSLLEFMKQFDTEEKCRTPLTKWFLAIYLMGQDKRGCSALKLKRELKIAYDTAWTMSHKIRKAMGNRDSLYMLSGTVVADDSFFGAAHEGSKLVRKEVLYSLLHKIFGGLGYALAEFANSCIMPGSLVRSDGLPAYKRLSKEGFLHDAEVFDHKGNPDHLKWLHTLVSNAKSFIAGTYHGLDDIHLQAFLDEFCFRFNRRYWLDQLFVRTLYACASARPFPRYDLIR